MNTVPFAPFPKIARLTREVIVTEKLDGTNAQVCVLPTGEVLAGSRTRWITPEDDNYGFARWVKANEDELRGLGPGCHFGEWWGLGIQRSYGMLVKRFSLFNVRRWANCPTFPRCCSLVPLLDEGPFDTGQIDDLLRALASGGSVAAPGFMRPEGVVVYHVASGQLFKKTIEKDAEPKGRAA